MFDFEESINDAVVVVGFNDYQAISVIELEQFKAKSTVLIEEGSNYIRFYLNIGINSIGLYKYFFPKEV